MCWRKEWGAMKNFRTAILLFIFLTAITGVIYPIIVTVIGELAFPQQATGSLLRADDGTLLGSALIGQEFSDPTYFWSRPSATADFPYNPMASGGSNLGPTNPELLKKVVYRVKSWHDAGIRGPVPSDLVLSSGSGLDPHISLEAAVFQVSRVARARGMREAQVRRLVEDHLDDRQWGFLGMPRLNVLKLNLALDRLSAHAR
jgi:K+-transporting ATPase ATPase C chain